MSNRIKLTKINQLAVAECLTLEVEFEERINDILVISYDIDKFAVYLNQCPHTGVNLNWQANQCFDFSEQYLSCSVHGALFRPNDGKCIYGPCIGQSLKPLNFEIEQQTLYLLL